jgi:glutathione S-transferase
MPAVLTISRKNYSTWALRGWLLCKMAGIAFEERMLPADEPSMRAELMLRSPSFLVPRLEHEGVAIWDVLAIGEYLHEVYPEAGLLPADRTARAHCRAVCGEMHQGFANLRQALPMNLKAHHPGFKIWSGAQADIDRIAAIWRDCLTRYKGSYLFGALSMADAMYAPVVTRFQTYDVALDRQCAAYCRRILAWPALAAWHADALAEPEELEELEVEF